MTSSEDYHRELITVHSEMLGERQLPAESCGENLSFRRVTWSLAYICPQCGDLWCRRTILPARDFTNRWFAEHRRCERCGDGRILTLGGGDAEVFQAENFPLTILRRELVMYENLIKKGEL